MSPSNDRGSLHDNPAGPTPQAAEAPREAAHADGGRVVSIQPRDPLVLRDARPFSADPGAHAFALPFPLPRTVAGAVRTALGSSQGLDWNDRDAISRANRIKVHGPLLAAQREAGGGWDVYVPAPRDAVFFRPKDDATEIATMLLRPMDDVDGGTDGPAPPPGPNEAYARAMANTDLKPLSVTEEAKPARDLPAWWSLNDTARWLTSVAPAPAMVAIDDGHTVAGLGTIPLDSRIHVSIDRETSANVDGSLFTTEGRTFPQLPGFGSPGLALLARVTSEFAPAGSEHLIHLGGERRIASLSVDPPGLAWPDATDHLPSEAEVAKARGLRLQLVTPAIFSHGWLPGWLESGVIPGSKGMKAQVTLKGAAIERRIPVSGWRLAARRHGNGPAHPPGPRATRYAVPAGGVYFFSFRDTARIRDIAWWHELWRHLWLRPVSDYAIDNDSGFGLALPGLW